MAKLVVCVGIASGVAQKLHNWGTLPYGTDFTHSDPKREILH